MSTVKIYRGQTSLLRETSDACSVSEAERIRQDDESVSGPVLCRIESAVQVSGRFLRLELECPLTAGQLPDLAPEVEMH
jgi:hypothetical protein